MDVTELRLCGVCRADDGYELGRTRRTATDRRTASHLTVSNYRDPRLLDWTVNRTELDGFFADAEDILTDWDGSFDASDSSVDETWWLEPSMTDDDESVVLPMAMLATNFQAALDRRRHRNTGPGSRTRLDGRRRRLH